MDPPSPPYGCRMIDPTWTKVTAGVYADADDGMHLVIPELLEANGYADTPANRATVEAAARDLCERHGVEIVDADA